MAIGTALSELRAMFKAECGLELNETISSSEDARINRLLSNQQQWLAGQHLFLLGKTSKEVALTAGTQYYTFPSADIDVDRLDPNDTVVKVGPGEPPLRYRVEFGITQDHYTAWDSEADQRADPVLRWDLVRDAGTLKIEVWPLPQTNDQTLVLSGTVPVSAMTADANQCVIDDLLIVLFAAAKYQARRGDKDAQATLTQAQAHLNKLRGSRQSQFERFNAVKREHRRRIEPRPIIGTSTT